MCNKRKKRRYCLFFFFVAIDVKHLQKPVSSGIYCICSTCLHLVRDTANESTRKQRPLLFLPQPALRSRLTGWRDTRDKKKGTGFSKDVSLRGRTVSKTTKGFARPPLEGSDRGAEMYRLNIFHNRCSARLLGFLNYLRFALGFPLSAPPPKRRRSRARFTSLRCTRGAHEPHKEKKNEQKTQKRKHVTGTRHTRGGGATGTGGCGMGLPPLPSHTHLGGKTRKTKNRKPRPRP